MMEKSNQSKEDCNLITQMQPLSLPVQLQNPDFRFVLLGKWNIWKNKKTNEERVFDKSEYGEIDETIWKPLGKAPFEKEWTKKGYSFADTRLLNHFSKGKNIGIIGGYGNLRILDIDNVELGKEFEKKLNTFTIKTGSGGKHFYLKSDYDVNRVLINKQGELRANDYQVVSYPSRHPNGNLYEIINDTSILEISKEDLLKLIEPYLCEEKKTIQQELKNDTSRSGKEFRKIIALLYDRKSKEEIFEEMRAYSKWNDSGDDYKNLTFQKAEDYVLQQKGKSVESNNKTFEEPLTIQELMGNLKKKRNPIIKNFVEENAIHTFYGNTGSLKSFLLIYMSVCIASGKPFLNHYKTRKCPVLYLSGENHVDLEAERVNAIAKGLKINIKRRAYKNIQFKHFSRKQIKLLNNNFYYEHLRETIEKNKIKVLVLDTLSVMTLDVNDNASQEIMKIFSEKLFPLVDEFGLSIIIIAHSQKTGKDYLGSVKNKGSVDLFFKVVREGNIIKLNCEKGRRGEHNCEIRVDLITHKDTDKPIKSITFNFLSESEGIIKEKEKQDISNKIEQAKELILGELEGGDELSFTDLLKICANNGISANPFKKAMNQLYDSKEIRKKAGKRGGYYVE